MLKTSDSALIFSFFAMNFKWSAINFSGTNLKLNLWVLEIMVSGNFSGLVVASIKTTCVGGSSSVLSRALKALLESIWTSSII